MLDENLKSQLEDYLSLLRHPLHVSVWYDDSPASEEVRELLGDLSVASSKISIIEQNRGNGEKAVGQAEQRTPCFAIHRPEEEPRVKFAGLPLGHEFTSLVLALLHVGGHPPKASKAVLEQIDQLAGKLCFVTYFSQSCQNCPDVIQALNLMAARNPHIHHQAIDGALFPDEVDRLQILAVPNVYLNGEPFSQGRLELDELLAKLDTGAAKREAELLDAKDVFDMLIVGGGPAGSAAAVYAARKGISTGMLAERLGGQLLDTVAVENFISVTQTEGPKLAAALEAHVRSYPVDIMKNQKALQLSGASTLSSGQAANETLLLQLESGAALKARSIILATGARWRNMNVPGEQEYRTRGVTYCPHCDGPLFKGKRVAVVGGGNSGIEAAIDLAGLVEHVTVLEFTEQLKADDILQRKLRSLSNVDVIVNALTTEVRGNGRHVTGIIYKDRTTDELQILSLAGVFVQIGLLPNTEWLQNSSVELTATGEIVIDDRGQTSVPGVFAAGDVTTVPYKQIIAASGDGAKAALGAFDYLIRASAPTQ